MSIAPSAERTLRPPLNQRLWLLLCNRTSLTLSCLLLTGSLGGYLWLRDFIYKRLTPLMTQRLSHQLKQPVQVGAVERFSWNRLRLGASAVLPTPQNSDRLTVKAIEVGFNPWQLLQNQALQLDVTLEDPTIRVEQAPDGQWVPEQLWESNPAPGIQAEVRSLQLHNAVLELVPTPESKQRRVTLTVRQGQGIIHFGAGNQRIQFQLQGRPTTGGSFVVQGDYQSATQLTQAQVRGHNLSVPWIDRLVQLPGEYHAGQGSGEITAWLTPRQLPSLTGRAEFRAVTLQMPDLSKPFSQAAGRLRFQDRFITLENSRGLYGQIPGVLQGTIHQQWGYNLSGTVAQVSLDRAQKTLDLILPFATTGNVTANYQLVGSFARPILKGRVQTLSTARLDQLDLSQARADFSLDKDILTIANLQATPQVGGQITGKGQAILTQQGKLRLDLQGHRLPGDTLARLYGQTPEIAIGPVSGQARIAGPLRLGVPLAHLPIQTTIRWQAPQATYPARGTTIVTPTQTRWQETVVQFAGGTLNLNGQLQGDRWQTQATVRQVDLKQFDPQMRGRLSGQLQLAGTVNDVRPNAMQAQGNLRFSQGIALVDRPLTAQVRWDGQTIQVQRATAPGFRANGTILAHFDWVKPAQIQNLNLQVTAHNYPLQLLPQPQVSWLALTGQADFSGQLTGTAIAPQVAGHLQLRRLRANQLAFSPHLSGTLTSGVQGTRLQVSGQQDRIDWVADAKHHPQAFLIRRQQAVVIGKGHGERLSVQIRNFPLDSLKLPLPVTPQFQEIAGVLNSTLTLNGPQQTIVGTVAITQPRIGGLRGDRLSGQVRYGNGVAVFNQGEFHQARSHYQLQGSLDLTNKRKGPQLQAQIQVAQAQVQDVLTALHWFDWPDMQRGLQPPVLGTANDVGSIPAAGLPDASLHEQLQRFSTAVVAQQQQQQQVKKRRRADIPPLQALQGQLTGEIRATGSVQQGLAIDFNLHGDRWQWDTYSAREVTARGHLRDGVLTLRPLQIRSQDSQVAFSGQLGGTQQSGELRIEDLPLAMVEPWLRLPPAVRVAGRLSGNAKLVGRFDNPRAQGQVQLNQGTLNGAPIRSAQGHFRYQDARLDFESETVVTGTSPVRIAGTLPLALPFSSLKPPTPQMRLAFDIENEGLGLLNLFSPEVSWVNGDGKLQVEVQGTPDRPSATGIAELRNATLKAHSFPTPLTHVNGTLRFNRDRVDVEHLQGQLSQGQVQAQGMIPIAEQLVAARGKLPQFLENPLTIILKQLALNLPGLYQGGVDGRLQVMGSLLSPVLGGEVQLSNGQIALPQLPDGQSAAPEPQQRLTLGNWSHRLTLRDLKFSLGDRVRITGPFANFMAQGDLNVNGTLSDPRPQGSIRLVQGQINLHTALFTLAPGHRQTATFTARQGLDPNLDLRMVTTVPEVTRRPQAPSPLESSEIAVLPPTSLGSLQSVRIEANVSGLASQLPNNIDLSSSPPRSDRELVSLLGGSFANDLAGGDSRLALASLASSALLTNLQASWGRAAGVTEFRIFPAIIPRAEDTNASTIDLAAEVGVNLSRALSASVLGILTSDNPFALFNLRYRVNNQFQFRGSTNFANDNRFVVEYENRF